MAAVIRHAYLHGFASSPQAQKALALARLHLDHGVTLHRPDLNAPSFAQLRVAAMLRALDAMHEAEVRGAGAPVRWRFVGSSLGGYLAALWAQAHPKSVDKLLLLCPAFGFGRLNRADLSADALERWRELGSLSFPDAQGVETAVHFALIEEARTFLSAPAPVVPTKILHARGDEVVPIEVSRAYVETHLASGLVELIETEGDHRLTQCHAQLLALAADFLLADLKRGAGEDEGPRAGPRRLAWDFFGPDRQGTAQHFLRHLEEFLDREGLAARVSAPTVSEMGPAFTVSCTAGAADETTLTSALRPHRVELG